MNTKHSDSIEVKMIICAGELRRKIEEAGKLLAEKNAAEKKYKKCRLQLDKMLKAEVDDDVPAYAKNYWAIRSHDKHDEIDVVEFLKEVTSNSLRRKLLKVQIGVAREELVDQQLLTDLVETVTEKETTLHVNKIKPKKEV